MNRIILSTLMLLASLSGMAQDASPEVTFFDKEENSEVTLTPGESKSEEAPLEFTCKANVDCPSGSKYKLEWRLYSEQEGEEKPILTRFEDDMKYTLSKDGTFGIKLYITFTDAKGEETEYESEAIKITIAGSKLSCPDGFSPNGDGINDVLTITAQSIVKVSGGIFNRWGQELHSFTIENLSKGWDGIYAGSPVKDGVYFININAYGADGLHYKIKKAINVLKGYRENTEAPGI